MQVMLSVIIIHSNARVTLPCLVQYSDAFQKTKKLPLHVSLARIERERADVITRTQRRIAKLRAAEYHEESHCCLYTALLLCFCVALLLFLQWLYYVAVRNSKQL
jgi:hypothetical protein